MSKQEWTLKPNEPGCYAQRSLGGHTCLVWISKRKDMRRNNYRAKFLIRIDYCKKWRPLEEHLSYNRGAKYLKLELPEFAYCYDRHTYVWVEKRDALSLTR